MKKIFVFILVLLFIAIAMVITCPEKVAHKTKVSEKLIFDKELKSDVVNSDEPIYAVIRSAIVSKFISQNLEVESYYVCSIGKMTLDGQTHPVSLGLFNHVFLLIDFNDFEDAKKVLK